MNQFADPDFWFHYRQLPDDIRAIADKSFAFSRPIHGIPPSDSKRLAFFTPRGLAFITAHSPKSVPMDFNGSGLDIIQLTIGCFTYNDPEAPPE